MPKRQAKEQQRLFEPNLLYYGDNLHVLREHIRDESIDLVYLDPPFKSGQDYNVLFKERSGTKTVAQVKAFEDTWRWNTAAIEAYQEAVGTAPAQVSEALQAFRRVVGPSDMLAYLSMMAPRLVHLHRVLKPTGSIYLHCDPAASHYLKVLMDSVFGGGNFRNEIVWRRTGSHGGRRSFGPIHQTIFFYSKTDDYHFETIRRPYSRKHVGSRYKQDETGLKFTSGGNVLTGKGATRGESGRPWRGFDPSAKERHWAIPGFIADQLPPEVRALGVLAKLDAAYELGLIDIAPGAAWPTPVRYFQPEDGQPIQDIWAYQPGTEGTLHRTEEGIDADVKWLGPTDPERLGYQTQKPVGLLERILRASCPTGGVVLDPFCGCGTSIDAAQRLGRRWIGIDVAKIAIEITEERLRRDYGPAIAATFEVRPEPASVEDALKLAAEDKHAFQDWALRRIGAYSAPHKKGADRGIDGRMYYHDHIDGETKLIVVSVKGGNTGPGHVRDLRGVMERETAQIGVFITMRKPTKAMKQEAGEAGAYFSAGLNRMVQRLQILTVEDLYSEERKRSPVDFPAEAVPIVGAPGRAEPPDLRKQVTTSVRRSRKRRTARLSSRLPGGTPRRST